MGVPNQRGQRQERGALLLKGCHALLEDPLRQGSKLSLGQLLFGSRCEGMGQVPHQDGCTHETKRDK